ncbi:MAG: ABC transporter substrate-binding protein [Nocardioides sp.]|nr:ABC transporter substrate-binding protein [Nocardioides sp.]
MNIDGIDRRLFIRSLVAAGAAAPLLASCAKEEETPGGTGGNINEDAINLVSLYGTSGSQAELGQEGLNGLKLASQTVGGEILGRPVEVVHYDTQEAIDDAVRRARESMAEGNNLFVGGLLSSTALAIGEEVNKTGGVFITAAGADELTTTECRSALFRWSVPTYGAIRETVLPMIEEDPSLKRWFTITPDYVFGRALLDNAKAAFQEAGVEHVGNSFHGLDATEFSGYINNAISADPDVLLILNFGAQSTTTIQQAVAFGVKNDMKILLAWSGGLSQFRSLGPETMEGVYAGAQYWHTIDAPGNKKFVELFQKEYGSNPSYSDGAGYIGGKLLLDAAAASSTDPAAVIAELEGLEYEGLTGPETIRAEDHQVIKDYYLMVGKAPSDMGDEDDFMEILSSGKSFREPSEKGCTLEPLGS